MYVKFFLICMNFQTLFYLFCHLLIFFAIFFSITLLIITYMIVASQKQLQKLQIVASQKTASPRINYAKSSFRVCYQTPALMPKSRSSPKSSSGSSLKLGLVSEAGGRGGWSWGYFRYSFGLSEKNEIWALWARLKIIGTFDVAEYDTYTCLFAPN